MDNLCGLSQGTRSDNCQKLLGNSPGKRHRRKKKKLPSPTNMVTETALFSNPKPTLNPLVDVVGF